MNQPQVIQFKTQTFSRAADVWKHLHQDGVFKGLQRTKERVLKTIWLNLTSHSQCINKLYIWWHYFGTSVWCGQILLVNMTLSRALRCTSTVRGSTSIHWHIQENWVCQRCTVEPGSSFVEYNLCLGQTLIKLCTVWNHIWWLDVICPNGLC